jgi:hypothetical protein
MPRKQEKRKTHQRLVQIIFNYENAMKIICFHENAESLLQQPLPW